MWAFQHFDGLIPDIVTSAKGLTGAMLPMSMVGVREKIRQYFLDQPLGWGSTYHAHPVALACAYECVKYTVSEKLPQKAKHLQGVMMEEIQALCDKHPTAKQGRAIGLFGCIDLVDGEGKALVHCCPPLVITESELRDGFQRLSRALERLDASYGLGTCTDIPKRYSPSPQQHATV